ncbi:hypothetical protein GWK47_014623 [Chionoecetes opilio]|uniref:Uncharacterized protein n=1 Tax=Chionoecetes opilio TaxID=41210 RepID=A0A8J5CKG2_CHIOP|nr:hypothetical protein GWK47_014623 [Chionoecetes opilio]
MRLLEGLQSPSRSRCVLPQLPPGGASVFEGCWMATSSVWRLERLSPDVRHDSSVPPVDERGTVLPPPGRPSRAVKYDTAVTSGDRAMASARAAAAPGWHMAFAGSLPPRPGDSRVNEAVCG